MKPPQIRIVSTESTFDDNEYPALIYKYRRWDDDHVSHKDVLSKQELWFADPSTFDDKRDCNNPVRWDALNENQIYEFCVYRMRKEFPAATPSFLKDKIREQYRHTPLRNKQLMKQKIKKEWKDMCNDTGILSLTELNNSEHLWRSYSDNGTGFCVGFDSRKLFKFLHGGGPVTYVSELPKIYPMPFNTYDEQINIPVFFKEEKWKDEEEYRVLKRFTHGILTPNELRAVRISKGIIREVILGYNMLPEPKREISALLNEHLPHIVPKTAKKTETGICIF